jgi:hypothetical protein
MGKRGPKSADGREGSTSKKGYRRIQRGGRLVMEHRWIWEQSNGPVPDGCDVHHENEDKLDNRIENLQLVDKITHKRLHSGCELRAGVWWKPCGVCGESKPIGQEHWYLSAEGWPLYGRCRPCHIAIVVRSKRARRLSQVPEVV